MKFDVVIGNPPYQLDREGTRAKQIYPDFMNSSYEVGKRVLLITPGRFLFNAGDTSKAWNQKMLNDPHLKVVFYESKGTKVFKNTDIKGGVAITYRNEDIDFGSIKLFVPNLKLKSILNKVSQDLRTQNMSDITFTAQGYKLTDSFHKENPKESKELPNKTLVTTNIFDKYPHIFLKNLPNQNHQGYIQLYGRANKEGRIYRWVQDKYIDKPENFDKWKVFIPKSNGSGKLGETLSTPKIGEPKIGHTQTFMSIGCYNSKEEANSNMKYIKTKFARVLLGILKVTQDNPPARWAKIPLQDFTLESDIDWSRSISEIDQQLYKKYHLNDEEIEFIENNVEEME